MLLKWWVLPMFLKMVKSATLCWCLWILCILLLLKSFMIKISTAFNLERFWKWRAPPTLFHYFWRRSRHVWQGGDNRVLGNRIKTQLHTFLILLHLKLMFQMHPKKYPVMAGNHAGTGARLLTDPQGREESDWTCHTCIGPVSLNEGSSVP